MGDPQSKPATHAGPEGFVKRTGRNPYFVFWSLIILLVCVLAMWSAHILGAISNGVNWCEALTSIVGLVQLAFTAIAGLFFLYQFVTFGKR